MKKPTTRFDPVLFALLLNAGPLVAGESVIKEDVQRGTRISASVSDEYGRVLTDEQGRALYILKEDSKGQISCYDACTRTWPPLLAARGKPEADDPSVKQDLLDTVKRADGHLQITYKDRPLYYYVEDKGEQNATGHQVTDVWGEWALVSPQGEPLDANDKAKGKGKVQGNNQ